MGDKGLGILGDLIGAIAPKFIIFPFRYSSILGITKSEFTEVIMACGEKFDVPNEDIYRIIETRTDLIIELVNNGDREGSPTQEYARWQRVAFAIPQIYESNGYTKERLRV
jgi:hypothetical protein